MFLNLTNHPSADWSEKQRAVAAEYGAILDHPFPAVDPHAEELEIQRQAESIVSAVVEKHPAAVLCQGEFTLVYAVVRRLLEQNVQVVSACSERKAVETIRPDGTTVKSTQFEFVRFRRYA